MAKKEDIATRAHVIRSRIYTLEEKYATSYPDQREKLAEEIEGLIAEYEALLPEIEAEAEKRRAELKRIYNEALRQRHELLMLLGQIPEPHRRNAVGTILPPYPDGNAFFARAQEYEVAPLRHYEETIWDQRRRNERAGKGYLPDEAVRRANDPEYWNGRGFKTVEPLTERSTR
jgi:ElaB/YqjD/DUF883 family membrane-anchored ribosome-binding protein